MNPVRLHLGSVPTLGNLRMFAPPALARRIEGQQLLVRILDS